MHITSITKCNKLLTIQFHLRFQNCQRNVRVLRFRNTFETFETFRWKYNPYMAERERRKNVTKLSFFDYLKQEKHAAHRKLATATEINAWSWHHVIIKFLPKFYFKVNSSEMSWNIYAVLGKFSTRNHCEMNLKSKRDNCCSCHWCCC